MSRLVPSSGPPLVDVQNLSVRFGERGAHPVVQGVSFQIRRGECLALVGESGSGKSVTARALVGLAGHRSHVQADRLQIHGEDARRFDERHWRQLRGGRVGFILQDALSSLDPLRPVGREIEEPLELHTRLDREKRQEKVVELLRAVGVPEPELRCRQYSHELSGGLRQRALIASAIACGPALLLADEPTTALDAVIQVQILELLASLCDAETALLVISHDFAVVARLADHVAVMHRGQIVEQGPAESVLHEPQHPYTRSLLRAARVVHGARTSLPPKAPAQFAEVRGTPLIEAQDLTRSFPNRQGPPRRAVSSVSLELHRGETLGIVGESGSGKTTLISLILGLEKPDAGTVRLNGRDWSSLSVEEQRRERRRIQVVFQDPLASFDPRYTVEQIIGEAVALAGYTERARRRERIVELLGLVCLDEAVLHRHPIELSGGQRQRVAIARALGTEPEILVCDEPVSALDVPVQAQILDLLEALKQHPGLSCLFISHDLGIVRRISDRVLVMKDGAVVESGAIDEVFDAPRHGYTRELIDAIPRIELAPERLPRANHQRCEWGPKFAS